MGCLWYVYLIRCLDDSLDCGISKDPERRLLQHLKGRASRYTRAKGVSSMVYQEGPMAHPEALRRERAIKALRRTEKEAIIDIALDKVSPDPKSPPAATGISKKIE